MYKHQFLYDDSLVISGNPVTFYHAQCYDGFAAAWAAWKTHSVNQLFISAPQDPEFNDQHLEMLLGKKVRILDISINEQEIEKLKKVTDNLTIIDHHETGKEVLSEHPDAIFDLDHSGAYLSWKYFHDTEVPPIIRYIEDRDLWNWELPYSEKVNLALRSYPREFTVWQELQEKPDHEFISEMCARGSAIQSFRDQQLNDIETHAKKVMVDGYDVYAVNSPILQSMTGENLGDETQIVMVWYVNKNSQVKASLRTKKNDIHVGNLADKWANGGGHQKAAGFKMEKNKFFDLFLY